jgi:hypothetical protein
LGCVLYRATTGELPFQALDPVATLVAVATHEPPPPRTVNPAVPASLDRLIMQLLAKSPDDRPQTARAVAEAIGSIEASEVTFNVEALATQLSRGVRTTFEHIRQSSFGRKLAAKFSVPAAPKSVAGRPSAPMVIPPVPRLVPERQRPRRRLLRVLVIVLIVLAVFKSLAFLVSRPLQIETSGSGEPEHVSVKLGGKTLVEVGTGVPRQARKAAETYLKGKYSKWSIDAQEMGDSQHATFAGTVTVKDHMRCFHLGMRKDAKKGTWAFDHIDLEEPDE